MITIFMSDMGEVEMHGIMLQIITISVMIHEFSGYKSLLNQHASQTGQSDREKRRTRFPSPSFSLSLTLLSLSFANVPIHLVVFASFNIYHHLVQQIILSLSLSLHHPSYKSTKHPFIPYLLLCPVRRSCHFLSLLSITCLRCLLS